MYKHTNKKQCFMGKSVVKVKNISAFCHYFEYLTQEYEKEYMLKKSK
jgi:hypothetical protein